MKKKIGIIGLGNMGRAIAEQLKQDYWVLCFDKDSAKTAELSGIEKENSIADLVSAVDVIILAVKPQNFPELMEELKDNVNLDKLVISIAAGISIEYIEKSLGIERVIRAMPNMPLLVGEGMTCFAKGKFATEEDADFAENLFDCVGEALRIEESMLNAVTAVSGNGPAYVAYFLDKISKEEFLNEFCKAAENIGFNKEEANLLVRETYNGTLKYLKVTGISAGELINRVMSKGGCTEAAFKVLYSGGNLANAVKAALSRAQELSEVHKWGK